MKLIVAKSGVNAEIATDPNDFIFHSDYNTFKIIETGTSEQVLGVTGADGNTFSIDTIQSDKFVFVFCKFANGRVGPPGTKASNADFWFTSVEIDGGNILISYVNLTGGNYTVKFKYYICELPI